MADESPDDLRAFVERLIQRRAVSLGASEPELGRLLDPRPQEAQAGDNDRPAAPSA